MKASFTCVNFSWDIRVKRQRGSMWRNRVLVRWKSWCLEGTFHSIYYIFRLYLVYIPLTALLESSAKRRETARLPETWAELSIGPCRSCEVREIWGSVLLSLHDSRLFKWHDSVMMRAQSAKSTSYSREHALPQRHKHHRRAFDSRSLWCRMQNKKSTTTTWGTDSQLTLWPRQALLATIYVTGAGGLTETPSRPISIALPWSTVPTCIHDKA